jgi:hypothetical protein
MTLAVAWIRRIRDCEELVVVSDSRLSGGRNLDSCAKLFSLPRSDSFLCCAGDTTITYPLLMQMVTAIGIFEKSRDRSLDVKHLRGHLMKILNAAIAGVSTPIRELRYPERFTEFLFGGYSWVEKKFKIWRFSYSIPRRCFVHSPAQPWANGRAAILFAGDWQYEARRRLVALLRHRDGITPRVKANFVLDWQPFEVLRDLLRELATDRTVSIGGPPQIMKVYQHMNCRPIGVFWPAKEGGKMTVAGRTLQGYEKPMCWMMDPDTFVTSHSYYTEGGAT